MDSSIPTASILSTISEGSSVTLPSAIPEWDMMVVTMPCTMEKSAVSKLHAGHNGSLCQCKTDKGFHYVFRLFHIREAPQVFTSPAAKNRTSRPYPMAFNPPLMFVITLQIAPPLKFSGLCVSSVQISASLSLQVCKAEFRFCTIQLSLKQFHLPSSKVSRKPAFRMAPLLDSSPIP